MHLEEIDLVVSMTSGEILLLILAAFLLAFSSPISYFSLGSNPLTHSSATGPILGLDGSATAKCQSPNQSPALVTCTATLSTTMADDVLIAGTFTPKGAATTTSVSYHDGTVTGSFKFRNSNYLATNPPIVNMSEWYLVASSPLQSATITCTVEAYQDGTPIDMIVFAVSGVDTSVIFDPQISHAEGWNFGTSSTSNSKTYYSWSVTLSAPAFVFNFGAFQSNPAMVGNEIPINSVTLSTLESASAQYTIASGSSPVFTYTVTPGESGAMLKDVLDGVQVIPTPEVPLGSLVVVGVAILAMVSYIGVSKFSRFRNVRM